MTVLVCTALRDHASVLYIPESPSLEIPAGQDARAVSDRVGIRAECAEGFIHDARHSRPHGGRVVQDLARHMREGQQREQRTLDFAVLAQKCSATAFQLCNFSLSQLLSKYNMSL